MWLFNSEMMDDKALRSTLSGILHEDVAPSDFSNSPFLALMFFLQYFSAFDWSHWGVGVTGLVPLGPKDDHSDAEASAGPCNHILTAAVDGHRSCFLANMNPFLPLPEVADPSPVYSPFSGSPQTLSRQDVDNCLENGVNDPTFFSKSQCAPSSISIDDVCVIHPLTGANMCTRKRPSAAAVSRSEKHEALSGIFSGGLKKISTSLTSAWHHTGTWTETGMGSNGEQGSESTATAVHRFAQECCPVIFATTNSTSNSNGKTSEAHVTDLIAAMQMNSYLTDTQKENIVRTEFVLVCRSVTSRSSLLLITLSTSSFYPSRSLLPPL